jgi:tripartite-type tricarboxylate transporter receptor subunit TctC
MRARRSVRFDRSRALNYEPERLREDLMQKAAYLAVFCAAMSGFWTPSFAQTTYPERPVSLVVPAPPGGGTDRFARLLAEIVSTRLGQKFVVENKAGGGGTVGVTQIAAARPDGYTLGFIWNSPLTTSPQSLNVAYTVDSYAPVMAIGFSSYVFCVAPEFPAKDGKEFIAELKANPGKYTYGNDGVGGTMQLAAERIFQKAGVKVRGVPFGGAGETLKNFLGGHVTIYGGSIPPVAAHVAAGKAKCLLLTQAGANSALPQASGLDAVGLKDEATVLWWGLIAPAKTPKAVLDKLEAAFVAAAKEPSFIEAMGKLGATPMIRSSAEMAKDIRNEHAALADVAKLIGLKKSDK